VHHPLRLQLGSKQVGELKRQGLLVRDAIKVGDRMHGQQACWCVMPSRWVTECMVSRPVGGCDV
jgi:hypothetical protein